MVRSFKLFNYFWINLHTFKSLFHQLCVVILCLQLPKWSSTCPTTYFLIIGLYYRLKMSLLPLYLAADNSWKQRETSQFPNRIFSVMVSQIQSDMSGFWYQSIKLALDTKLFIVFSCNAPCLWKPHERSYIALNVVNSIYTDCQETKPTRES